MTLIDIGLYLTYILIAVAALAAIVFPIIHMAKDPADAKKSGLGILVLLVVFGIAYVFASGEPAPGFRDTDLSSGELKLIGAGLNTFFILVVIGVLSIVVSEVMSWVR